MTLRGTAKLLCAFLIAHLVKGQTNCGNCNTTGHGPGCTIRSLEICVCDADPYCCNVQWDGICVAEVFSICGVDCSGLGQCPYEMDGNLEVLFPPLIDEDETHVDFNGASTNMKITIMVPKQYSTAKFDFEGASNPAGGYDSTDDAYNNPYWVVDALTDPCNKIYHGYIPWLDFRTTLGGLTERRFSDAVYYDTEINIEVTKNLTLTPETLLLEDTGEVAPQQSQEHIRYVRNKIPFEIKFDLELKLWHTTEVTNDHLRVAAAIVDSSVLDVDPDYIPIANAMLDFVTVIPLPLILTAPVITVDVPELANGITIEELVPLRNCSVNDALCNQHWHVMIHPEQCTLNGQYIANMTGVCHPDATNCISPQPDFSEIVMDVTSDDFCGIVQEVDITGSLSLDATDCNDFLHGTVEVSNPEGGAINHTEILKIQVSPTLVGSQFLVIYDGSTSLLNYSSVLTQPDQVDFEFLWLGSELRCDIIASIDVIVAVEFEATRSLQVLSMSTKNDIDLQAMTANNRNKVKILQNMEEYEMRMLSHAAVIGGEGISPEDVPTTDGDASSGGNQSVSVPASTSASMTVIYVLVSLIAIVCVCGTFLFMRMRRQRKAHAESPAAAAIGMTPRKVGHKRTISQAVMSRVRAHDAAERTPLHTPDAHSEGFFHDE